MDLTTLICYFTGQGEARKSLREIAWQGFTAAALIHKGFDGAIHTIDPFSRRRVFGTSLVAILFGGCGGIATFCLNWLSHFNKATAAGEGYLQGPIYPARDRQLALP